ncbi:MAG: hypothetical protein ABI591_07500 [Kofleriaceae bacterium]
MRSLLVAALIGLVALVALAGACTHSTPITTPRGSWHGTDTLANVPADTPYLFAWLEAPPEAVRTRLMANADALIVPKLEESAAIPLDQRLEMPAARRALLGIMDAMRGTNPAMYWENLGFKRNGQWIMYGLGVWPVLRVEVADANKLRAILADAVKTLNLPIVEQKQLDGVPYWVASKDKLSAIASVTEHDAVVAIVPTASLAETLPMVLGTKPVARSLRDSGEIAKLSESYHLAPYLITYLDSHRIVDALERKDAFATTSVFSAPACHADYERIADAMPRLVFGYEKLDANGFMGTLVADLAPDIAKRMAAMHTAMPAPPDVAHALVSIVIAADVDTAIANVRTWMQALVDHPFECPVLAKSKEVFADGLEAVNKAIPSELHGLHGAELVLDDATEKPPSGSGYVVVAGDQVAMTMTQMLQKIPGFGGMTIAPDGQPVELPVGMLGVDGLRSAHLAMHTGRVAIAVGDRSKTEVSTALAAPNAAHSPLAILTWDVARFIKHVPSLLKNDNKTGLIQFSTIVMSVDVRANALVFEVGADWLK